MALIPSTKVSSLADLHAKAASIEEQMKELSGTAEILSMRGTAQSKEYSLGSKGTERAVLKVEDRSTPGRLKRKTFVLSSR